MNQTLLRRSLPVAALIGLLGVLVANPASSRAFAAERKPKNIVLILTDNHGAWTLGCYGNPDIRTPHLDQLAAEGALFTKAFSVNPVCSPTRASILTGLMPSQHGIQTPAPPSAMMGPEAHNLLAEFTSLPEILKTNGYACGLSGKWHLGDNLHPQEGLDDLWVTMPIGSTAEFYGSEIIENGSVRTEPGYMTDLWTDRAVGFIREQAKAGSPFFLYLAYNGPYGLGRSLLAPARNRHAAVYEDQALPSFPRVPTRPWQFSNREYVNNPVSFRRYAAEVSGIDDGVGRVMEALREAGALDDTLIVFTGDQGLGCGQNNLWGMGDHTRPLHAFDSTMHVPLILRHPGSVPAGTKIDRLVSQVDLLPTILALAGLEDQLPVENPLPGRDLTPLFAGTKAKTDAAGEEDAVFFEFENTRVMRTNDWKLIERTDDNGKLPALLAHDELYDLAGDPGETRNLYNDPAHRETRDLLGARLADFFAIHRLPKYDMWQGGDSQIHHIVMGDDAAKLYADRIRRGFPSHPFAPDFNPPSMTIPDGLAVETAAASPLVNHPVAACLDDRGRLFVCENTGDNLPAEELEKRLQNRVTLLTDTNGDGVYDQVQTFAEGFTFPQGCLWHDGALYVASPPAIWKLVDTDDDGHADVTTALATGFGYNGNAASVHTPVLSPAGRLYWAHGRKPSEVRDIDGTLVHQGDTARIWTCRLDGRDLRTYCGGGMANPVELDFWPTGEAIGDVNILTRATSRSDCLVHWQHGGVYPRADVAGLNEFVQTGPLLGEIFDFGHVAVAGLTRYRSGALGPEGEDWRNQFFVTLFNTQELLRLQIIRDGATFRAVMHPLLTIDDPDVHLVGVKEDADGSLLLIDTGGWFRQGCPSSGIAKPDIPGAIYRIRKAGLRDVATDYRGRTIDWAHATPAYFVSLLSDARPAVRDRAMVALTKQPKEAIEPLSAALATHPGPATRIRAAYALCRLDTGLANAPLRDALLDADPEVRLAATNAIAERGDKSAVSRLLANLHHVFPALQRETAVALGRIGDPSAVPDLVAALSDLDLDRPREHALLWALIEIDDAAATRAAIEALRPVYPGNTGFARRTLIALDRIDPGALLPGDVANFLSHRDDALRATAIELLAVRLEAPAWSRLAGRQLERILALSSERDPQAPQLEIVRGLFAAGLASDASMRAMFSRFLAEGSPELRDAALAALAQVPGLEPDPAWLPALRELLAGDDPDLLAHVLAAVKSLDPQPFEAEARALAADESKPNLLRVQALRLFEGKGRAFGPAAFNLLESMLATAETPLSERLQAVHLLVASGLTAPQQLRVAKLMAHAGPLEFPLLAKRVIPRKEEMELGRLLCDAYLHAPGAGAVPAQELKRLLISAHSQDFWRDTVAQLEERIEREKGAVRRLAALEAKLARGAGDAVRGREVALSAQAACIVCHHIGEQGNRVGPDLSQIGKIRQHRDLLESILFPSASLAQDYESFQLTTTGGEILAGVVKGDSLEAVDFGLTTGEVRRIPRSAVASLDPLGVSLMPQGLDQILTEQQLLDLVAYLASLK